MKIRSYTDDDLAAVAALFTASIHGLATGHYDAAQRAAWAPQPPDLDEWRRRLQGLNTLLAETQGRLAGFLAYAEDGHVDLLYTAPDSPRKGVASALYAEAEAALFASGVRRLYTEASLVARPFFERQGFVVREVQDVERRGLVFRRYAMDKTFAAAAS